MDKLNQRTDKFSIVLNDSGANVFVDSRNIVNKLRLCEDLDVSFIACIKHTEDVDKETQHKKTPHYHLVLRTASIMRLSTVINVIVSVFRCNDNQISIEKCSSLEMQTRYLVHFDDLNKFQYKREDIVTNSLDTVDKYFKYISKIDTIEDLISICREYLKLTDLMTVIGYEKYKKYRVVIADIRKDISQIY